jgi:hypothetical protein
VHGSAATATHARLTTKDFGECGFDVGSLGEHMPVSAVSREENVLRLQMSADTDGDGFLSGREVRKAGDFTRRGEPLNLGFEGADPPQSAKALQQSLARVCGGIVQ